MHLTSPSCFISGVVISGLQISGPDAGYGTGNMETYNPGQTCQFTLPAFPASFFQEGFISPIVAVTAAKGLVVCGTVSAKISCFTMAAGAGVWTGPVISNLRHPSYYLNAFLLGTKVFLIDDTNPEVLDLNVAPVKWDATLTGVPVPTANPSGGGGCSVVLGDYVYVFGGQKSKAIRRIFVVGVLPANWVWEYLTDLPNPTISCSALPLPNNKNLIAVTLQYPSSGIALYDIYQNTVTIATTTPDLYGADLVEFCRDGKMFAVELGTSAKSYLAPNAAGLSTWQDVATPLNFGRSFATTIVVPRSVLAGLGLGANFPSAVACPGC